MSNMGYCRWQLTLRDLQDCDDHIMDSPLSEEEEKARTELLELCGELYHNYAPFVTCDANEEE
jgi:hypothetical protein